MIVKLHPADFLSIFNKEMGDVFIFVTSPHIRKSIDFIKTGFEVIEVSWNGSPSRIRLLQLFRHFQQEGKKCSVIWICADEFEHFFPGELEGIKLGAISFFSSSFSANNLDRILRIVKETNYQKQNDIENRFLDVLQAAKRIIFHTKRHNSTAVFEHHQTQHWFSLHGPLSFGQQTVLPTGQISTLANASGEYSLDSTFTLNGNIVLKGYPILHRGGREITMKKTMRMFEKIKLMNNFPLVAQIENGMIVGLMSPCSNNPFLKVMERLLELDNRYGKIHEICFGTHVKCSPLRRDNFFPNYRYPGVVFGLGLGGYTPFHFDLLCTEIDVLAELNSGKIIDIFKSLKLICKNS